MIEKIKEYQAIILMVLLFIAGWIGHGLYNDKVAEAIAETRALAAQGAAEEIARIEITNKNIYNKVIERTSTSVQYRECKHDAEVYSDIKKAFGDAK